MILDALHLLPKQKEIDADVCIIGAGPAGLVVARELLSTRARVVLLESGGLDSDAATQELNAGRVVGSPYADLRTVRHRQVGGTVNVWNTEIDGRLAAKYVPLDPIDFESREGLPHHGWPFGYAELEPWYRKAQALCGLGPFDYGAETWAQPGRQPLALDERLVETRVYQFGLAAPFLEASVELLRDDGSVRLVQHATVVELVAGGGDSPERRHGAGRGKSVGSRRVRAAIVAAPRRAEHLRVNAEIFVLAAGAIENARLLLCSEASDDSSLGNERDLVGRYFMEHPRDYASTLIPSRAASFFSEEAAFYDRHRGADGTIVMGRLAIAAAALRSHGALQASATLIPVMRAPSRWSSSELWKWAAPWLRFGERGTRRAAADYPRGEPGWSGRGSASAEGAPRARAASHGAVASAAPASVRLLLNLEQAPAPENRVVLGKEVDALGRRRAELHWRWTDAEQRRLAETRRRFAAALETARYGRVQIDDARLPDPNAHHHSGTTRMHTDPGHGVVDADCRVHEVENLFVAGASVFPTAGFANPTLTIVALAARLGAGLADRFGPARTDRTARADFASVR